MTYCSNLSWNYGLNMKYSTVSVLALVGTLFCMWNVPNRIDQLSMVWLWIIARKRYLHLVFICLLGSKPPVNGLIVFQALGVLLLLLAVVWTWRCSLWGVQAKVFIFVLKFWMPSFCCPPGNHFAVSPTTCDLIGRNTAGPLGHLFWHLGYLQLESPRKRQR